MLVKGEAVLNGHAGWGSSLRLRAPIKTGNK